MMACGRGGELVWKEGWVEKKEVKAGAAPCCTGADAVDGRD